MQSRSAILKLSISMAIFGSIGFFTIQTGIPALELVFVRCIFATIILFAIWRISGTYRTEVFSKSEILKTALCGVFLVLNWVFLFKAFEEMAISIAISIYNLAPIFVLIIVSLFFKEHLSLLGIASTVVCFIGTIFIIGTNNLQSIEAFTTSGFLWALLSALCYAMTMITSKQIHNLSSYALTFIQTIIGIFILLPFCDFSVFAGLTTSNWFYIVGTGIIHTGFVYYLFFDSVRFLPSVLVSVLVFIDPLVAVVLDVVILNFTPSVMQMIGMALVFGSILITVFLPSTKKEVVT